MFVTFLVCLSKPVIAGARDLERLYWMVYNNQDWLQHHLDIVQVLPLANQRSSPANFLIDYESKPVQQFNPILENEMIGPCRFDHVSQLILVLVVILADLIM